MGPCDSLRDGQQAVLLQILILSRFHNLLGTDRSGYDQAFAVLPVRIIIEPVSTKTAELVRDAKPHLGIKCHLRKSPK
jgi:hypothetical protein